MRFILASGSPRRRELLSQIGIEYEVVVSDTEEISDAHNPANMVEELAIYKCQNVMDMMDTKEDICIIGADTVVAYEGEVLGKPENEKDAFNMLRKLSGHTHQVFTGVAILICRNGMQDALVSFHEETQVKMYDLSDEEINSYIESGEPMDKAGAYGIQAKAARFIAGIEGDYYNVVGLPVAKLYHELKRMGIL